MLQSIYIDNYALIDRLEIEFSGGLTIVTGETGAGKSILLGALGLLLGKRADTSVLKDESRKCIVEGVFNIKAYHLEEFFQTQELEYEEETIIRREISGSGKSRAFINDTPVNLNALQELSLNLIDIHSQHQNLSLNNEDYIRWIIDTYAKTEGLAAQFRGAWEAYRKALKDYEKARAGYLADKENLDFLSHRFEELQAANLKTGELEELEQEHDLLAHAEDIKIALAGSANLLDNEDQGILIQLNQTLSYLEKVGTHLPVAEDLRRRIETAYIDLKDISGEIMIQADKLEYDPARLEYISQRIEQLHHLLRKYRLESTAELIDEREKLDEKLQQLAVGDFELEQLQKSLQKNEKTMLDLGAELSQKRRQSFAPFSQRVQELIAGLGLQNAEFSISHQPLEPAPHGMDRIGFLFSANAGLPPRDIAKVASGGELSRLMLAIKSLISDAAGLPTIIFDEIDTGVSGEIADKVGNLIRLMSGRMQVINITHLPQVASKGDQHFRVRKATHNGFTETIIEKLSAEERIREIAKMLSGDSVTEAAIENARVLLKSS